MRMQLKTWGTVLELKDSKSKLTETDRIKKISEFIEELSSKKCFGKPSEKKDCSCLSSLQGDNVSQDAIASYILYWAQKTPLEQKMVVVEKINGVLLAEKLTNTRILRSRPEGGRIRPFVVPFFATNIEETNEKLGSMFICKESLSALHHYGRKAFATLVQHAKKKTRPVHGNAGRVNSITNIHRENIVPLLEGFFSLKKYFPLQDPDQHSSRIIFSQRKALMQFLPTGYKNSIQ